MLKRVLENYTRDKYGHKNDANCYLLQVYGITVDPRHLSLIADFMTFDGTYRALNRGGMDQCPSAIQQMSFETSLRYLKNAAVRKLKDITYNRHLRL